MKKFLLATVGLVALGMTAPASAADLAARPYKAPPPVVAVYDWTGFYIGANGGATNAGTSTTSLHPGPLPKAATMRQAEWLAVRLDTVGRAPAGCSVWKRKATGLI
jgi:opacity protein-like surface antigen